MKIASYLNFIMRARVHTRHNTDNPSLRPVNRGVLLPLHPGNLPSIAPKVSAKSPFVPVFTSRQIALIFEYLGEP